MPTTSLPLELRLAYNATAKLGRKLDTLIRSAQAGTAREHLAPAASELSRMIEDARRAVAPVEGELLRASTHAVSAHREVIDFAKNIVTSIGKLNRCTPNSIHHWLAWSRLTIDGIMVGIAHKNKKVPRPRTGLYAEMVRAANLRPSESCEGRSREAPSQSLDDYRDAGGPNGALLTVCYCQERYNVSGKDLSTSAEAVSTRRRNPAGRGYIYPWRVVRDIADRKSRDK
jgi:hypothetical protein